METRDRTGADKPPMLQPWQIAYAAALGLLFLGLYQRSRIVVNEPWWVELQVIAPLSGSLRTFWLASTGPIAVGLLTAAVMLLRRHPSAAFVVAGVLATAMFVNSVEILLLLRVQGQLENTLSLTMGVPRDQIDGLRGGIAKSVTELFYKGTCLLFLLHSRKVKEAFEPVTWTRLREWAHGGTGTRVP